jgi:hypothetical protein
MSHEDAAEPESCHRRFAAGHTLYVLDAHDRFTQYGQSRPLRFTGAMPETRG